MVRLATCPKLADLIEYLDGLSGRADLDELGDRLRALDITPEDVAPWLGFCEEKYQRNLIKAGPGYQALILCWRSGQRSAIHDHAASACGVKVIMGTATETVFEPTPCGLVCPTVTNTLHAGEVCVNHDSDIHQVSNYQPQGCDLATLHIYTPPLKWANIYSLERPGAMRVDNPITYVEAMD
ncbi:MAG: cysteine dioxygenase family protein [Phycisphaeraceae bacterium]|nr:cysteine dioxygenase family protein [Phycisphaeraceae bacterium]